MKPVIKTLILKTVSSDTMMNELEAGTVDVLYSASGGDTINAGLDLVEEGVATRLLTCVTATASCSSTAVCSPPTLRRSARPSLTAWTATSSPVSTPAVTAPWCTPSTAWPVEYQESVDWINENLNTYDMNVEAAIALLEEDGWTLTPMALPTPAPASATRMLTAS